MIRDASKLCALLVCAPIVLCGCVIVSGGTKIENSTVNGSQRGSARGAPTAASTAPLTTADALGVWTLTDDANDPFVLTIGSNGKAVTNWSKGAAGPRGESGTWTIENGVVVVTYTDGWRDTLQRVNGGIEKRSFAPGVARDAQPSNWGMAVRPSADVAQFVGTIKLPATSDSADAYISLDPDGSARGPSSERRLGCWQPTGDMARIWWNDGSYMVVQRAPNGWVQQSWKSGADREGPPTLQGPAERIQP